MTRFKLYSASWTEHLPLFGAIVIYRCKGKQKSCILHYYMYQILYYVTMLEKKQEHLTINIRMRESGKNYWYMRQNTYGNLFITLQTEQKMKINLII